MPPLNVQDMPSSNDYWSWDSTTELWAPTAKLLLTAPSFTTVMYGVQGLAFLWSRDSSTRLSSMDVEAYSTLLWSEYTPPLVKADILRDLKTRAISREEDVPEIVTNSVLMLRIAQLVRFGDMRLQQPACELLGHLGPSAMPVKKRECSGLRVLVTGVWVARKPTGGVPKRRGRGAPMLPLGTCPALAAKVVGDFRMAALRPYHTGYLGIVYATCVLPAAHILVFISVTRFSLSTIRDENQGFVIVPALRALSWVVSGIDGAKAIVDVKVPEYIVELLESPNSKVRSWSCQLIGRLVYHQSLAPAILEVIPWERLVSFLSDADLDVIDKAGYALGQAAALRQGAQAVVDAKVLDCVMELFQSPSASVRKWACWLVGNLACHESIRPAILELDPYAAIIALLRDDIEVVFDAIYALAELAVSTTGAREVISANVLDHIMQVLGSPSAEIRSWSCRLVENLACHEATAPAVFEFKACVRRLVSLLRDPHADVKVDAIDTLSSIARWSIGAEAVVDAADPQCILRASPKPDTPRVHRTNPPDVEAHTTARVLLTVAVWPDGAQAAVDAKVVDCLTELLQSPSVEVQKACCRLIQWLLQHDSIAPAVLTTNPCVPLVSLLHTMDVTVVKAALETLGDVAWLPDGATAVIEAKALEYLAELLGSPAVSVRESACYLVGDLADHSSTAPIIINMNPCVRLVSLLHDKEVDVVSAALFALYHITRWSAGARAAHDAQILGYITELLESPDTEVKRRTCGLVATLADHESTAPTILQLNLCAQLISFLQSTDVSTRFLAALGLARINEQTDRVPALANTTVFESLKVLRDAEVDEIEVQAYIILANLACRQKGNKVSGDSS
ncbi:armadillo-type protein [Mycena maculata]|uniref:Vacuolar protein 8 n=1 Tax=Mycena maculata TaxID=230809 RepID=A0AAD7KFI9_9AGAR|nr:armadillo-type protein [Mycena maculata]